MNFFQWLNRFFWGPPKVSTLDELVVACKTPEELLTYAKCHFSRKKRDRDALNWQIPAKAFSELQARDDDNITDSVDCDNFAVVFEYVLRAHGYKPSCVYIAKKGMAHAVCSYLVPGGIRYIDNFLRISQRYNDATEMCHDIFSNPVAAWYMVAMDSGYYKGTTIKL